LKDQDILCEDEACRAKNDKEPAEKRIREWLQVTVNVILVIVGIVAICIYYGQLNAMLDSNKISHESLVAVQRAFMAFHQLQGERRASGPTEKTHTWHFTAIYVNDGPTPAIDAINAIGCDSLPDEPTEQQFTISNTSGYPVATLAPKVPAMVGHIEKEEAVVFGSDLGEINHPLPNHIVHQGDFFCWGWIAYGDIFPETKTHVTEFCFKLVGLASDLKERTLTPRFSACIRHNCTDENCEDYKEIAKIRESNQKEHSTSSTKQPPP
jgi:hypothetical protein